MVPVSVTNNEEIFGFLRSLDALIASSMSV